MSSASLHAGEWGVEGGRPLAEETGMVVTTMVKEK